ncbi:MAG: Ig-like domain-containing protein, partial [Rhodocyclales bacterium]|nr:Ig-like domain-containing protein [Rhodocyclales bacterium]
MAANDVCLLAVESENQAIALTTANGFVEVPTWSPQFAGTAATNPASRLALFWKRTVGGDPAPVVGDSGDHTTGQIHCFSGVITSGDPWDTGAGGNDGGVNDTTGSIPGATTTSAETLVVLLTSNSRNFSNTANCSAWTNADLASLTERTDNTNTASQGGGHCLATGVKATAGPYTTTTVTLATTSYKGAISLALKPIPTTTLATGTDPAAATIAPGAGATDVDLFTLQTSAGTEAITSVTVNLSTSNGVGLLAITDNANTVLGSTAAPLAGSNTIAVAGMTATTTPTSFKVRVTPLSHAAMPAVPGADYAITAPVTSWAGPNTHSGSDTNATALTIDNLSPAGATAASGVTGNSQTTLSWTTSAAGDFVTTAGSVIYRWTGASAGSEVPAEGSTPAFGATNGTATVACVVSSAASTALSRIDGPGSSSGECTTAALTAGQAYTYKVFQKDTHGNYDTGVAMGTITPHGAVSAATSTVLAVPTSVPADTYTTATITVTLKDSAGTPVPGKTVTLAADFGSSVITTLSGTTDASGIATFSVKNGTTEGPITYTATDSTDSIAITQTAQVTFTAPSLCFTDDFNRSTLLETGNWTRTKSVGTTLDAEIVSNRLRLTDATGNRATAVHLQRLFPGAGNKVVAEFDLLTYGGTGADGLVLTLSDSSIAPVAGAFGGSLGYAQKSNPGSDCTTPGGCPGFAGGWIGVGLDEYGNFSNPTEGRVDGPGAQADSVTIRGSGSDQSGYNYHTQSGVLSPGIDQAVALPAITHVGAGTLAAANGGNVTPTLPGHQADDLLLCAATSNDNTAHSVATGGWAQVYQLAQTGSGNPRSSLFYKKAASAAETNPTFTHTVGGGIVAGCTAFRGVDTTTPFDVAYAASHTADTVNSNNVTSGSMSTVTPDAMMLFAGHINNNNSCSLSASVTGGLTWNESLCFESNQGNDETVAIHYATLAAAGAIGPITFTGGNNDNRGVLLALRPQPAAVTAHRYRVTVDHSNGTNAFVTVDRDLTGTGTSYANVIATYDAKAIATQAAVPPYWFFSFTASTGGATNVHEIDNLTVCTAQPISTPVLDHVRIIHDGSALTCAPETLTIKACANAACTALYPNSVTVDLAGIAGATWSTDPVTFSSGQVQVTLSKPTTGTVTLGGSATAPSSMTAICYNGATSGDCSLTYSSNACAFDAAETGSNPSTPIYTKLAGTAFAVDVMALTAGVINTGFTGAVTVDLVDQTGVAPGTCSTTSLANPTAPASPYTFTGADAGRRTFTFNYANAAPDVRVRMVSGATTACSSDNFAIRPPSFSLSSPDASNTGMSGTPTVKAGTNFGLDAASVNGYTGTALVNSNRLEAHAGAVQTGILSGSFAPATLATGWISKGTTFSYSEVGSFRFAPWGIYDDGSFADVDRSKATPECFIDNKVGTAVDPADPNVLDGNGKYGCYFGGTNTSGGTITSPYFGRFIPDHFALTSPTVTQACATGATPFTYFGQDGFTTVFTLTAQNAGNGTTQNYVGDGSSSWAKLPLLVWGAAPASAASPGYGFAVSTWAPSQPAGADLTASATAPAAANWAAGSTTVTALHEISRPTDPALPTTVTVTTLPVDADGVTLSSAASLGTSLQRFGILRLDNAYGSELLPLRVTARTM